MSAGNSGAPGRRPACPPWCATDHSIGLAICDSRPYRLQLPDTRISAYARRFHGADHLSVGLLGARMHLGDAADARALAVLLDALADATPEQVRELADAIRRQGGLLGWWEANTDGR